MHVHTQTHTQRHAEFSFTREYFKVYFRNDSMIQRLSGLEFRLGLSPASTQRGLSARACGVCVCVHVGVCDLNNVIG